MDVRLWHRNKCPTIWKDATNWPKTKKCLTKVWSNVEVLLQFFFIKMILYSANNYHKVPQSIKNIICTFYITHLKLFIENKQIYRRQLMEIALQYISAQNAIVCSKYMAKNNTYWYRNYCTWQLLSYNLSSSQD